MKADPKKHKYVSLLSVLMVFFSGFAIFALVIFLLAFIHRIGKLPDGEYDLITLADTPLSYALISAIFVIFLVLVLLVLRSIWTLNNPTTVMVTIQYVDQSGNFVQITKQIDDIKEYKKQMKSSKHRFQKLTMLDKKYPVKQHIVTTDGLTLEYICRRFRSFCCSIEGNPLYYSIKDIRRWFANMGVSKIVMLQGMSGTGKTSLPVAFGKFIQNQTCVVPVQPMWKERSDLLGYFNEFTGKFNESMILEKLYEANKSDNVFIIILDEVNIARIEYYFAEFLSLLELPNADERWLEVTSSISKDDPREFKIGKLKLADNIWFVGTANNDDSTFSISDKVYDRSMTMNLDYRCEPFVSEDDNEPINISMPYLQNLFNKAKKEYSLTKRGRMHIREFDDYLRTTFGITFGNRIRRQIQNYIPIYIACGGTETEAIDDIITMKVLRKLESQNPVFIKSKSEEIISKLDDIFGLDTMPTSKQFVRKLASSL